MFGNPDWSSAVFPQQRRTEGCVWRGRQSCLQSAHAGENNARGQSHTCVNLHANYLHTCHNQSCFVLKRVTDVNSAHARQLSVFMRAGTSDSVLRAVPAVELSESDALVINTGAVQKVGVCTVKSGQNYLDRSV